MKIEPGKAYRTRDGRKVKINPEQQIAGELSMSCDSSTIPFTWTSEGKSRKDFDGSPHDIISEWEEPQTPIVDWSTIPPWHQWVAKQMVNCWTAFSSRPHLVNDEEWVIERCDGNYAMTIPADYAPKFSGDWKNSLVKRPKA